MEGKGQEGEELAAKELEKKGYRIRDRNWRIGQLELDIVAEQEKVLVVVEVKTQKNRSFGHPEFRVNKGKQKNLFRAANAYVTKKGLDHEVRFDIIAVIINDEGEELHHIENAFIPHW